MLRIASIPYVISLREQNGILYIPADYMKGSEDMFKKIFSTILVLFICCSASITVFAQAEHSHVEENITDAETTFDFHYVQTTTADAEYSEWLLGAPDEILSASTIELLEYFLASSFMGQQVYSCSSTMNSREIDLSCHEAFRELVSREDLMQALEDYAESILNGSKSNELEKAKFEKLLVQPFVESLLSDSESTATDYPNLRSIYTASEIVLSSTGDLVGTINNIRYYSAGTISTANNRNVEVCTPHREWSSSEIADINNIYDYTGNTRLDNPTTVYNCHSYAWYRYSTTNPYWIMDIWEFTLDSACTQITSVASAQAKDIVVYLDENGVPLHSGVVYSVSPSGELTICSKWGQAGAYMHSIGNVPQGYYADPNTGKISYLLFRYHDYANKYTGREYHSGSRHYFQYANICEVCNKQINATWKSKPCSGPPCSLPRNLNANAKSHGSIFYKVK